MAGREGHARNETGALSMRARLLRCGADTKPHYVALLKEAGPAISTRLGYREASATQLASVSAPAQ
jgi:IclR family KDG regulon transcriptional repressor